MVMGEYSVPKPVSIGEILELDIISRNAHGEGMAKVEEFIVFVKDVGNSRKCRARIIDVKRTYAMAEKV
jgi:predicted RNA-binding protein with TRAM domain